MKIVSDFTLVLPNKDIDISVGYSAGFIFDGNRHLTSQELQAFFDTGSSIFLLERVEKRSLWLWQVRQN